MFIVNPNGEMSFTHSKTSDCTSINILGPGEGGGQEKILGSRGIEKCARNAQKLAVFAIFMLNC